VAKIQVKMPQDFLLQLSRLKDKTDEIIPKVLESGGEIVLAKVKANLQVVIGSETKGKSRSTGELVDSLGVSPAKLDRKGNFNVKVSFREPRKNGESNAKIANIIEYGKSGQPPKPFLKPASSASRKACIEAMQQRFEEEVKNL
jgi:HK97 gp10 family phage protein